MLVEIGLVNRKKILKRTDYLYGIVNNIGHKIEHRWPCYFYWGVFDGPHVVKYIVRNKDRVQDANV